MPTTPTSLALTNVADNSQIVASAHRNNYSAIQTAVNSLISFLSGGSSSQVVVSGGGTTINYAYPPGYQYDYATATATVSVTATSGATANAVVTGNAITYDGSTTVQISFYCPRASKGTTWMQFVLYDGATELGQLGASIDASPGMPIYAERQLTPSAAAHTYSVKAYVDAGTGNADGGAGTAGLKMPMFIRIVKV